MTSRIRIIVAALLLLLLLLCGCGVAPSEPSATVSPEQTQSPEPEIVPFAADEPVATPKPEIQKRFRTLFEQNPDFVGWLTVPGTPIDLPVVYCEDNEFYLSHDFERNPSQMGTLFADMSYDPLENNGSLTIFGHFLAGDAMFGSLHRYKELDYVRENPTFIFDGLYGDGEYIIFSVFYMAGNDDDEQFYYYPRSELYNEVGVKYHIRQLVTRTIIDTGVDIAVDDDIVILTCCTYETADLRFSIAGRRLRPGEDPTELIRLADWNPDPLYPQKWYDLRGGEPKQLLSWEEIQQDKFSD